MASPARSSPLSPSNQLVVILPAALHRQCSSSPLSAVPTPGGLASSLPVAPALAPAPPPAAPAAAPAPAPAPRGLSVDGLVISRPTAALSALALLPVARPVPACCPGRTLNTGRPANQEAYIGHLRGVAMDPPCAHCTQGFGVWEVCMSVAGFFGSLCTNCHYSSKGVRCSLQPGK